jgi:four helix bundle protein
MLPVHNKAKEFSLTMVKLGIRLQKTNKEYNISNQLIRSATSINANLHEARASESLKDYTHKVSIAFKESREVQSWLTLLKEIEFISESEFTELNKDINAISSALYAITVAMRKKLQQQKTGSHS